MYKIHWKSSSVNDFEEDMKATQRKSERIIFTLRDSRRADIRANHEGFRYERFILGHSRELAQLHKGLTISNDSLKLEFEKQWLKWTSAVDIDARPAEAFPQAFKTTCMHQFFNEYYNTSREIKQVDLYAIYLYT